MLGIGVVAEYVGRIYEEVKQRTTFLVRQRDGAGLASKIIQPTDTPLV
jgi:hypothetical protein